MKPWIYRIIIIAAVLFFPLQSISNDLYKSKAKDYTSIRVYFVRWDLLTRKTMTPEDARRIRHVYMEINDIYIISKILDLVFTSDYSKATDPYPEPAHLVLDFMNHDSIERTVYANSAVIVQDGSQLQKKMDHDFIQQLLSSLSMGLESIEEATPGIGK